MRDVERMVASLIIVRTALVRIESMIPMWLPKWMPYNQFLKAKRRCFLLRKFITDVLDMTCDERQQRHIEAYFVPTMYKDVKP